MSIEFHEFDRDGDLLLLLKTPSINDDGEVPSGPLTSHSAEGVIMTPPMDETTDSDAESSTSHEQSRQLSGRETPCNIHMLLSSKVLMLASPVFKAMLGNDAFQEGRELQSTGKVGLSNIKSHSSA